MGFLHMLVRQGVGDGTDLQENPGLADIYAYLATAPATLLYLANQHRAGHCQTNVAG